MIGVGIVQVVGMFQLEFGFLCLLSVIVEGIQQCFEMVFGHIRLKIVNTREDIPAALLVNIYKVYNGFVYFI